MISIYVYRVCTCVNKHYFTKYLLRIFVLNKDDVPLETFIVCPYSVLCYAFMCTVWMRWNRLNRVYLWIKRWQNYRKCMSLDWCSRQHSRRPARQRSYVQIPQSSRDYCVLYYVQMPPATRDYCVLYYLCSNASCNKKLLCFVLSMFKCLQQPETTALRTVYVRVSQWHAQAWWCPWPSKVTDGAVTPGLRYPDCCGFQHTFFDWYPPPK